MKYLVSIVLAYLLGCMFARAQTQLPVTTQGLTDLQCVQSQTATIVQDAGACPGRTQVINATLSLPQFLNSRCGAYVVNTNTSGNYVGVTLPSLPSKNCTFTFEPGFGGFYVTVSSTVQASQPAAVSCGLRQRYIAICDTCTS